MIKLKPKLINKYFSPEIKRSEIDNIIDMRYVYQYDTCGNLCVATTKKYIEIFNFRYFFKHFVFINEGDKICNKQLKNILTFLWLLIWDARA